ncbi:MAG: glycosyltransferase family 39 protein [Flavobacteriales bacterium]|nr:glycosyltransferase family 39 protein [Flavobacteriales bacterium]
MHLRCERMFDSYFTPGQQGAIALAMALALLAIGLQAKKQHTWALLSVTASAFVLRLFAAWLDPFLNDWDEVFHAVVAKNMLRDPFTPMLYTDTALPLTESWTRNHVWLHKPPFFLWQMALSLKIFGLHPWAIRLPSVLWMTALVPVTARMAWLISKNRDTAFAAGLLVTFCYYIQELVTGSLATDHNDAVFIALVACSWWSLLEHWHRGKLGWALLVGLFSACAVLTKWYVGLCVFLPWGLVILGEGFRRKALFPFLGAALIALSLAGAWWLSIRTRFPELAASESRDNWLRFTEPFEGHGGSWTYHFDQLADLLPPLTIWILLPGLVWLVLRAADQRHRIFLIALPLAVHAFFAVAATKMDGYTMVLLPLYMIALANLLVTLINRVKADRYRAVILSFALVVVGALGLDLERTQFRHSEYRGEVASQDPWRERFRALAYEDALLGKLDGAGPFVIFNVPSQRSYELMFRSPHACMDIIPTQAEVDRLRAKGYSVVVVQDTHLLDDLPKGVQVITDGELPYPRIQRN